MDRKKSKGVATRAAQYLMDTGQLLQFTSYMGQDATAPTMPAGMPPIAPQFPKGQEVAMLESRAKMLGQQLEQIKKRLEELIT